MTASQPPATSSADLPETPETSWTADDLAGNPHAVADKAQRVQRMFDAIARSYDLNNRLHSFGRDQAWRRAAVQLSEPGPADDVLDVACGTGDLSLAFARAGVHSVTGLDFAENMLEIARRKAADAANGHHRLPQFIHGDAMNLPFDDQQFDIVSIAFGIRNVSDPEQAAGEFHRVLRPGGRLVVLEFSEPGNPLFRLLNRFYTRKVMPITASIIARDRSGAYRYLPRSVETFSSPGALADLLSRAGFSDVTQTPLTFGVCTATVGRRAG